MRPFRGVSSSSARPPTLRSCAKPTNVLLHSFGREELKQSASRVGSASVERRPVRESLAATFKLLRRATLTSPQARPPSKSENASFSVAALLVLWRAAPRRRRVRVQRRGRRQVRGEPFAGGGMRPGPFCGAAPMEEKSWPSAMNRSAGDAPGIACDGAAPNEAKPGCGGGGGAAPARRRTRPTPSVAAAGGRAAGRRRRRRARRRRALESGKIVVGRGRALERRAPSSEIRSCGSARGPRTPRNHHHHPRG